MPRQGWGVLVGSTERAACARVGMNWASALVASLVLVGR